jgi:hypothetical protein
MMIYRLPYLSSTMELSMKKPFFSDTETPAYVPTDQPFVSKVDSSIMNDPFQAESPTNVASSVTSSDKPGQKKNSLLNKFLSKTYHMINSCDDEIACWSNGGRAFTIKDQERFEKEALPAYFNHSKFSSFARQLNFYNFTKLRGEPDLQLKGTQQVRYSHPYFQQGKPELLHHISRSTAVKLTTMRHNESSQVDILQQKVDMLQQQVNNLEGSINERVRQATEGYLIRIRALEASYERLLSNLIAPMTPPLVSTTAAVNSASAWPAGSSLLNSLSPNLLSQFILSQQQQQQQHQHHQHQQNEKQPPF